MKRPSAILCLCFLMLSACGGNVNERAERALDDAGFIEIELTGHRPFACADSDFYNTGFKATNPHGKRVSGVVCMGSLKGSTIRFD